MGCSTLEARKSPTQDVITVAKPKSLPPIPTSTIRTSCVRANVRSIAACPCCSGPSSAKSRPGLKCPVIAVYVDALAPEQARSRLRTPPPMAPSALRLRWHPRICSAVPAALSSYAVGPRASTRRLLRLVLPAQRPASPET